jgi:hypothetical protein
VRPADNPHSSILKEVQRSISYFVFYTAFVGGSFVCLGFWYANTRRKDDGKKIIYTYICTHTHEIYDRSCIL